MKTQVLPLLSPSDVSALSLCDFHKVLFRVQWILAKWNLMLCISVVWRSSICMRLLTV